MVRNGRRGIRKWWAIDPGATEKGPKSFEKMFFEKRI